MTTAKEYFNKILESNDYNKILSTPSWIPTLSPPKGEFVDLSPTYQEVARTINRSKLSASPCPYDQLSTIILKRCPILKTLLHRIIVKCWSSRSIPGVWKRGVTILIYKKGDTSDPENFRPITLQPSWYKIFSSIYTSKLNKFLNENGYMSNNIQKGFKKNTNGVQEHSELLQHIIHTAKTEQRSICITLLDLRNAFGSVEHFLIRHALRLHHVPKVFSDIFEDIYRRSFISIAVNNQLSDPIKVQKGVLQGDPLSPTLFNLCMNSFLLTIKQQEFQGVGFSWGGKNEREKRSWLQYADDATALAPDIHSMQDRKSTRLNSSH